MKKSLFIIIGLLLVFAFVYMLYTTNLPSFDNAADQAIISSPEEVAAYIHEHNRLPENYITKSEAVSMGWQSNKGNLWDVTDHMSIGGDLFGNREKLLPSAPGRIWKECDVNYQGGYRGAERLVYSNDGLIYYTGDHYATFTKLY